MANGNGELVELGPIKDEESGRIEGLYVTVDMAKLAPGCPYKNVTIRTREEKSVLQADIMPRNYHQTKTLEVSVVGADGSVSTVTGASSKASHEAVPLIASSGASGTASVDGIIDALTRADEKNPNAALAEALGAPLRSALAGYLTMMAAGNTQYKNVDTSDLKERLNTAARQVVAERAAAAPGHPVGGAEASSSPVAKPSREIE